MAASFLIAALLAPLHARALTGEGEAWFGPSLANLNALEGGSNWGPGLQAGALLELTDFWRIAGGLEASYHFADSEREIPAHFVYGGFLGLRYALDVFQYVPFVGLALTAYPNRPPRTLDQTGFDLGAKLTIGVDWRRSRSWSFGALTEIHLALSEPSEFPIYSTINLHFAYHFRLF